MPSQSGIGMSDPLARMIELKLELLSLFIVDLGITLELS
jgi:hypothetical protein